MATDTPAGLNEAKHGAFTNGKYHADREAFFDFWDKSITFGVLLTGAVAFLDVFGNSFQKVGAAVLGVFALLQLVAELSKKARDHSTLKKLYFELAAKMESGELAANAAGAAMLRLAGEERPPYCALHAIAENWATRAIYGDGKPLPCRIGRFQRILRNWSRFEGTNFGCS